MSFDIDNTDILDLELQLERFRHEALPFATRFTLNGAAFQGRKIAQDTIRDKMITRNRWTTQGVRVKTTRSLNIGRQRSVLGHLEEYMADQEFGATKRKKGSEGVPIATSYSAGQGMNAQPRTRLPRGANKLRRIKLRNRRIKAANRRQRNLIAVKGAAESGRKFVYLELARRKGIFRVTGGKRRTKVKMVHDLTHDSIRKPRNPWLKPSFKKAQSRIPGIYFKALKFQLDRHNIF